MLTKKQFDILTTLEKTGVFGTQRELAEATGMSLGIVNKTLSSLTEQGLSLIHILPVKHKHNDIIFRRNFINGRIGEIAVTNAADIIVFNNQRNKGDRLHTDHEN